LKVIILSAGQGRRLLPMTADKPKCAVEVAGASVLTWQLREISHCKDISEVVVVTGFATDKAEAIVADFRQPHLTVRTQYNPFYANSDNLGTCWIARHEMAEPFILINGDTLFRREILARLVHWQPALPITLTVDRKACYDDDDMKVILENGQLRHVGKKLDRTLVNGESIGMTRFDGRGAELFRSELERSMRFREGLGRWYLSAIDAIAQKNPVGACIIEGMSWCEIDTLADVNTADAILTGWSDHLTPLQESAQGG
jgi:choline kinase